MILWVIGAANDGGIAYIYRAGANLPGDDVDVVVPDDGIGRWILNGGQSLSSLRDVNISDVGTNDVLRYFNGEWRNLRPQRATDQQYGTVILGPGFGLNAQGLLTSIVTIRRISTSISSYTLTEQDSGCLLICEADTSIIIPTHESYPSLIGTQVALMATVSYGISYLTASGVTLRAVEQVTTSGAAYSMSYLLKLGQDEWLLGGETA